MDGANFAGVGYPKVGNTWLRVMLGRYIQLLYDLPSLPLGDREEFTALSAVGCSVLGEFTHFPLEWVGQTANDLSRSNVVTPYENLKVVLLVRHPLDTLVSSYMQERYRNKEKAFDGTISEFVRDSVFGLNKLMRFYQIWAERADLAQTCLWRYEDAKLNSGGELRRVLHFLGAQVRDEFVVAASEFASFDQMKFMEKQSAQPIYPSSKLPIFATGDPSNPNAFHVRRGEVGGYRAEFPEADLKDFEALARLEMPSWYGYS